MRRNTDWNKRGLTGPRRSLLLFVIAVGGVLLLSACGSSSSSSSTEGGSTESATASTSKVEPPNIGKKIGTCTLEECQVYPQKVDLSVLKGKKIGLMGLVPIPGVTRFTEPVAECVEENGGTAEYVNLNGEVAKAPAVLEGWVAQGFAGIAEDGVEVSGYKSLLESAQKKNIPIVLWTSGSGAGTTALFSNLFKDGQLDAEWIVEQYPEGGTVLGVGNRGQIGLRERMEGWEYVFAKHPEFNLVEKNLAQLTTAEAEQVTSAYLQAEPNVIAVIGGFPELAFGAQTALQQSGSDAPVVSADGDLPEYEEMEKPGSRYKMTVADGHEFGARLACEIIAAQIAGIKAPANRMLVESYGPITSENLPTPPGTYNTTPRPIYELTEEYGGEK